MSAQPNSAAPRPGFFARIYGNVRSRIRRIFGKGDAPNIYPFF